MVDVNNHLMGGTIGRTTLAKTKLKVHVHVNLKTTQRRQKQQQWCKPTLMTQITLIKSIRLTVDNVRGHVFSQIQLNTIKSFALKKLAIKYLRIILTLIN